MLDWIPWLSLFPQEYGVFSVSYPILDMIHLSSLIVSARKGRASTNLFSKYNTSFIIYLPLVFFRGPTRIVAIALAVCQVGMGGLEKYFVMLDIA